MAAGALLLVLSLDREREALSALLSLMVGLMVRVLTRRRRKMRGQRWLRRWGRRVVREGRRWMRLEERKGQVVVRVAVVLRRGAGHLLLTGRRPSQRRREAWGVWGCGGV